MHDLSVSVLSSGSCGNSALIENDGRAILIDAGLSCRELDRRLSLFGVEPTQIEALVLTHEHTDHMRGARRFCLEHGVTAYATRGTLALTPLDGVRIRRIVAGQACKIGGLEVMPFKVRHMAAEPVALSVSRGSRRIGFASDLGSVTREVVDAMKGSNLMLAEANYDDEMLMSGDYPDFLKRAIRGDHGHLSNDDAALLSAKSATSETEQIVLIHLSRENNEPEKAVIAVKEGLRGLVHKPRVEAAEHGAPSGPFRLG
jgi:phosphoribosyl 1,2-cyclic phosphodiesterase